MSKFTRDQLKDLVKECLVEILSEGLASPARASRSNDMSNLVEERHPAKFSPPTRKVALPSRSQSPALNSTIFNQSAARGQASSPAMAPRPAIVDRVGQITADPILSQILADTATTTLQEQIEAESSRPGSPSLQESVGSPTDLFEGAQHWATLAFSDSGNRGQKLKS